VRQLANARLLTVRGDGHGILTQFNQCALGAAIPYIDHGALPPKGATCEQDIPFADSPAPGHTQAARKGALTVFAQRLAQGRAFGSERAHSTTRSIEEKHRHHIDIARHERAKAAQFRGGQAIALKHVPDRSG
jgi:hypothetical protein